MDVLVLILGAVYLGYCIGLKIDNPDNSMQECFDDGLRDAVSYIKSLLQ